MASKWKKVKMLLGLHACAWALPDSGNLSDGEPQQDFNITDATVYEMTAPRSLPSTPNGSSSTRNSACLSKNLCAICLETMKPGNGHALFTAECSHTFHFPCISSNVIHGNLVCPVCRAKWHEVPRQSAAVMKKSNSRRSHPGRIFSFPLHSTGQIEGLDSAHDAQERRILDPALHILDQTTANSRGHRRSEPVTYDDDEPLVDRNRDTSSGGCQSMSEGDMIKAREGAVEVKSEDQPGTGAEIQTKKHGKVDGRHRQGRMLEIHSYPEVSTVSAFDSRESFTILVHLKAPPVQHETVRERTDSSQIRAPLDLVTVLDVSGSMAGTKLALLKQAMGFVIRNLSSADRLAVIAFSTTARRIFPLRRMVEEGRQQALHAIDALVATGGTNISAGLKKGAKVLEDCRHRNPVSSIMLLSDGQDTYTLGNHGYSSLSPSTQDADPSHLVSDAIKHTLQIGHTQIPVHTFGFGADHDSDMMHTISEVSGGTFSFIQAEGVVQDAFAQCIGGLLSVVVQDVQLIVSCGAPDLQIINIQAGSYESNIADDANQGITKLGNLYADEERDILVEVKLPSLSEAQFGASMPVLQVVCMYKDPLTQGIIQTPVHELCIFRPAALQEEQISVCLEVDRHRNRLRTAQAIAEARNLADQGNISAAQNCLQIAKAALQNSASAQAGDRFCGLLQAELTEIEVRMANRRSYERYGRAFLLSAQSSHSQQRATTRGESLETSSRDYQTPSMVDMLWQSQTLSSTMISGT